MSNHQDPEAEVFGKPLVFESQHDLYEWLLQACATDLSEIDSLSFTLILPSIHDPELELENVQAAMRALPNVGSFAMYKRLEDCSNATHHKLYDDILRRISKIYPKLVAIGVHTDDHSLNFLRSFEHLRKLQFTGFAASTPMETLAVLSRLRHLVHIEIVPALHSSVSPTRGAPCLSREVVRSLRHLKHMTLRESRASDPSAPAFFTMPFLMSLTGMARVPLTRLSVELTDFAPDSRVAQQFGAFLAASHLKRLSVLWGDGGAGADAEMLSKLPRSLVHLVFNRIHVNGLEMVAEKKRAGQLPFLADVTIKAAEEDSTVSLSQVQPSCICSQS
jgi:hypothetical protein